MANDATLRGDLSEGMLPAEYSSEIIKNLPQQSLALQLMRKFPMSKKEGKINVASVLPMAYWVSGDTGMKQTSRAEWEGVTISAEELAVIIPIPDALVDDSDFDLWAEILPSAVEAIAMRLDAAAIFGQGPFASSVIAGATAGSLNNTVQRGTATQEQGGIAEDLNQLYGKLERQGYRPNGNIADITIATALRGARDTTGQRLFDVNEESIAGRAVSYGMDGVWDSNTGATPELITGDWSKAIIGTRQDIQYKLLDQAVIQDPSTGDIVYNLAQQDMTAMRLTARFGFALANPVNRREADKTKRHPFGYIKRPA